MRLSFHNFRVHTLSTRVELSSMKTLVVIPSVRNPSVVSSYVENAVVHGHDLSDLFVLVLTENFVEKQTYIEQLKEKSVQCEVLNQSDRDKMLEESGFSGYKDVFPKKSHAETSFGLFYMKKHLRDFDVCFFIDDDTIPLDKSDYFESHFRNLEFRGKVPSLGSDKRWVNVLHKNFLQHGLYPRGYPYSAMHEVGVTATKEVSRVVLSQGLWTNIPDLDAVRILMDGDLNGQAKTRLSESDYGENFTVEAGNYLTVCSMNLAFRGEVIPAFYQFKMDDNPWGIGRFDDIWSGVVLKKIADSFGWTFLNGSPLCEHNKEARSTFKDLRSEVAGLEANERFFSVVDKASVVDGDIFERVDKIAVQMVRDTDSFIQYNGERLAKWTDLQRRIS